MTGSHRPVAAPDAVSAARRSGLYHQQYIKADASRSGIARLLKREGMARLEHVIPKAEGETLNQEDLQGLRAWLYPYRHQVFATDAG
jgi:hypothetical protein